MNAALKRGVKYGILRRYRGHYFLPTGDELDRANRIAMRFARLSMPAPLLAKINSARVKNRKRLRRIVNGKRKSKKVSKTHHSLTSVSVSPSLVDKLVDDVVVVWRSELFTILREREREDVFARYVSLFYYLFSTKQNVELIYLLINV